MSSCWKLRIAKIDRGASQARILKHFCLCLLRAVSIFFASLAHALVDTRSCGAPTIQAMTSYCKRSRSAPLQLRESAWRIADLGWDTAAFDDKKFELAIHLAQQGTFTEEAGLLTALRLGCLVDDIDARRMLAQQASDEAKHSEAFERYLHFRAADSIPVPVQETRSLLAKLEAISDPFELFLVHTLLEGMALDEFSLLEQCLRGDLLASIYSHVRRDESNHVSMGVAYLRRERARRNVQTLSITPDEVLGISGLTEGAFSSLANISGRMSSDVHGLLRGRLLGRWQQIFT